jgi:outer membrane receptor for ferrienterochelin and colicin
MKIQCTRHFLKRCKEQNLDPQDLSKCLKDEGLMIQGVVKWRLQNGIEIVVNGVGNRLVLITVVGTEKRKRGIYGRNKTFKLERSFAMPIELERIEVG